MSSYRGVVRQARPAGPRRPLGVALLAGLGVLGSLLALLVAVGGLWSIMRVSFAPSREFGLYGLGALLALLALWASWGFWEMVKSAWWSNMALALLGMLLGGLGLASLPAVAAALGRALPQLAPASAGVLALAGAFGLLVYNLVAVVYLLSIHAAFGVGVKDERPLWQKVQRN